MTSGDDETWTAPKGRNLIHNLDQLSLGPWNRRNHYMNEVRKIVVPDHFGTFAAIDDLAAHFNRRVTAICWHQKFPYLYAAGSKFGDIVVGTVQRSRSDSRVVGLDVGAEVKGDGPGGSITAMKFDQDAKNILYRSSIDCKVSKIDLEDPNKSLIYHDTGRYEQWFTSMDVNFKSRLVASGDCLGNLFLFDLDGKKQGSYRLHKSKIHHVEFSKKDPDLFVTAGTAEKAGIGLVKLWDIRKINLLEPLHILPHKSGVNVARFNPTDGSKLMTSDQNDEIRIYQGPVWNPKDFVVIKHHHKQFQHITPIKADWHPLADLIVIGKYPLTPVEERRAGQKSKAAKGRTVELYDPESRKRLAEITPPVDQIVSLNVFNPTGEYLASGSSGRLVVWRPSFELDFENSNPQELDDISQELQDKLRGKSAGSSRKQTRREYSPAGSDDENEGDANDAKKSKRRKKLPASVSSPAATASRRSSRNVQTMEPQSSRSRKEKNTNEKKGGKR